MIKSLEQFLEMDKEVLSKVDMTEIYEVAGMASILKDVACPTILLAHQVPDIIRATDGEGHQMLTLNVDLSKEEKISAVSNWITEGNGDSIKMRAGEAQGNDMSILYAFAAAVARSLGIRCPLIFDLDKFEDDIPNCTIQSEGFNNRI